jgi:transposase
MPSVLDAYKATIDKILEDDRKVWRKQRHTAKRIFERLRDEDGYTGSYGPVQRYVRKRRAEMCRLPQDEFLDLLWEPGYMQVDFGDVDVILGGVGRREHFLACVFPFSDQGLAQVFLGQTSECLCQGLADIFSFIGGVPHTLIFDNMTAAGRRIRDIISEGELFARFRLHYGFKVRFCNPEAGHEKGCVENLVGTIRRNMFVPIPVIDDIGTYNDRLLKDAIRANDGKVHYRKDIAVTELFKRDLDALLPLPTKRFDCVRYESHRLDKYGNLTLDGCHLYSVDPHHALKDVDVAIRAHTISVLDGAGQVLCTHTRAFGSKHTESIDPAASLPTLIAKPGAWAQSRLRDALDDDIRTYLDAQPRDMLVAYLKCMEAHSHDGAITDVTDALSTLIARGGTFTPADVSVTAMRAAAFGAGAVIEPGPDLSAYDELLLGVGR